MQHKQRGDAALRKLNLYVHVNTYNIHTYMGLHHFEVTMPEVYENTAAFRIWDHSLSNGMAPTVQAARRKTLPVSP